MSQDLLLCCEGSSCPGVNLFQSALLAAGRIGAGGLPCDLSSYFYPSSCLLTLTRPHSVFLFIRTGPPSYSMSTCSIHRLSRRQRMAAGDSHVSECFQMFYTPGVGLPPCFSFEGSYMLSMLNTPQALVRIVTK